MRYYVANDKGIPYHEQPAEGYTKLQAIARVQREIKFCIEWWGGQVKDYISWLTIYDKNFHEVTDQFRDAI